MRTTWGSATDRGRVRPHNEDSLLAYPPVFMVADGMGGHSAGDVASRLAVEEFGRLAGRATVTPDDVHACIGRVAERLRGAVGTQSAGTTVAGAAVVSHEGSAYWLVFNIGDSRVYRWAAGTLEQISVDHSVVQEMVDSGELHPDDAREHPERHVITRAVGTRSEPDPDYWLIPAAPADRLLICSDGLTTELDDTQIARLLATEPDPQEAARSLVASAVEAGGHDNVSAVVVDVAAARDAADVDTTVPPATVHHVWDEDVDGATQPRPTRPHHPEVAP
ncbi:serine/threonine-protein phosphatase [Cellulomonas sp. APG4]|uniref:PP2C family protein-serine/threonine phosphatase n=1 Tax=Cellulomonas sp. APG4 TaxID=1538656 RepID=UPI00137AA41C|nr:serine/threonine-protein phosphatase [Cellulomonas sp. APG4]